MLEELKQVGILLGQGGLAPIEDSNIKTGFIRQMSREQIADFCQSLEVLLVAGAEPQDEFLIEEVPCALVWFALEQPEMLPEKYDACFVRTGQGNQQRLLHTFAYLMQSTFGQGNQQRLLHTFAYLMQSTLEQGFEEFGQVEDLISRFTEFSDNQPDEESCLLLWLGTNLVPASAEEDAFCQKAQQLSEQAEEQGLEFYCAYHTAESSGQEENRGWSFIAPIIQQNLQGRKTVCCCTQKRRWTRNKKGCPGYLS